MTRVRRAFPTLLVLPLLLACAALAGCGSASDPIEVRITLHYSHFEPARVVVPHGQPITFVLQNDDPIDHEWLVGDAAMHEVHRNGTEAHHDSRPTEVSVPALSTRTTTITFDSPGILAYICHLPGHEAYGMVGTLVVT